MIESDFCDTVGLSENDKITHRAPVPANSAIGVGGKLSSDWIYYPSQTAPTQRVPQSGPIKQVHANTDVMSANADVVKQARKPRATLV